VRRSTKTTDRRKAEAALPNIASAVYTEFDTALANNSKHAQSLKIHFVTKEEILADPRLSDPFIAQRMLPPLETPKDPSTKLSRFIPHYINYLEQNEISDHKERRTKRAKCEEFMRVVGDIHLEDIKKVHAYQYADWMNAKGLANKTIKSAISRVSVLLVRAEQAGIIEHNPFNSVVLANYGRRAQSYLPFNPGEMNDIFAQEMPEEDRLALTLLATTGARLDEIALLEWSQVKTEHSITYLDLRTASKLKNVQSRRVVPVHSKVVPLLKKHGIGRIFTYPKDIDGKAQNAAGKRLSVYVKSVTDDRNRAIDMRRVAALGGNPKAHSRAGVGQDITFETMARRVHERKFRDKLNNGKHIAQWIRTLESYAFAKIGKLSVQEIHQDDIELILNPIWTEKPETARRVLQRISTVLDHACGAGYRTSVNPATGLAGLMRDQRDKPKNFAAIDYHHVPDLWNKLSDSDSIGAAALRFTILTALRSGSVRLATWDQFDDNLSVWTIPEENMKGREGLENWLANTMRHCRATRLFDLDIHHLNRSEQIGLANACLDYFESEAERLLKKENCAPNGGSLPSPPKDGEDGNLYRFRPATGHSR